MKKIILVLMIVSLALAVEDGQSLRNNAGEHVLIGATDSTGSTIKWLKVTSDGYLITSPTATPPTTPPTLGFVKFVAEIADSAWVEGNTLLSFSIFNDDDTAIVYLGLSASLYIPIYPRTSFTVPNCGITTLHIKSDIASTDAYIAFTY